MDRRKGNPLQRLVSNTTALSLTQVARLGFNMVLSVLVARQLGAEGLGKFAVLTAYLQIFQIIAKMGVHRLGVREMARQPGESQHWFQRMVVNQVLGAGGSAGLLVLVAHLLNHPADTTQALGIVSLSLLPFAISSAAESAFQAREQMGFVALTQVGAKGVQVAGSVMVLLSDHGIAALAWMVVLGQCVAAVIAIVTARRMNLWRGFHVDLREAMSLFRQAFDFFIMSLSVNVFSRLDVLILSQMVGEKAVGLYNAAYLIVRVINFLSASYSEAAYPVLSRLFVRARARFETLLRKSLLLGMTVTLLVAVLLAINAEPIIDLLYRGEEYTGSASLLRILSASVVVSIWNALLSKGLIAGDLQRRSVVVSGVKLATGLVYSILLTAWMGAPGTAVAVVLAGLTGVVLNTYFLNKEICSLDLVALAARPLAIGIILLGVLWMTEGLAWPVLVVGGVLLYISLLLVFRVFSLEDISLFRQAFWPMWQRRQGLPMGSDKDK